MKNEYLLSFFLVISFNLPKCNCYIFSVVLAVYNTGRYLDESLGSLLNQTIGYKNIQIILVNDGSTDNSEEICLRYKKKYNNIIYIKVEHGGVGRARNIGMSYAEGKYINFLDPDDLWDIKAFYYILLFFKSNKGINFVTGRLKFFEARKGYHTLDYKYYKTRIVNVSEEYNSIHSSTSTSFFCLSYIKDKKFEEGVLSGEDTRFINSILLINPIYGIVKEALYFYRRREDFSSRTQTQKTDVKFYFSTLNEVSQYLIDLSISLYDKIVPFIQYYIIYDILFRIESTSYKYLNSSNYEKYCRLIQEMLHKVEDKYILEQKSINEKYKILAISKKYNEDLRYNITCESGILTYLNYSIINLAAEKNILYWRILSIKDDELHIEGYDNLWIPKEKYDYYCLFENKIYYPTYREYHNQDFNSLFGIIDKSRIVIFDIPLKYIDNQTFYFYIHYMNCFCEIFPSFGKFTHIPTVPDGYYISGNHIFKIIEKRIITFHYNERLENKFEEQYCNELIKEGKNNIVKLREENKYYKSLYKTNNNKEQIWIINDRKDKAGDNGEYFFRYLKNKKPQGILAFFAIKANCSDYRRLIKYGNILDLDSNNYRKMFLRADKIISSSPNLWVDNPFGEEHKYIRDLFFFDFVFIQNGIIKDNLSKNLDKHHRNIYKFVTSTKREYKSILSANYGYNSNNIILTGLPRYDNLEHFNKIYGKIDNKKILLMPTWRKYIKRNEESSTYENIHSDAFIDTEFFNFYNNLINDENLINSMKSYNYEGIFCLHQNFAAQWIDFKKNQQFIIEENCNFHKLLIEGSLLVTDYSSLFFDFGYLKKPVIYTHFDYELYRASQYPEGYFDYKKDGFGPIYYDINTTVNAIIDSMKNNCQLKNKYLKRIKSFFSFFDEHNNDRLFRELTTKSNIEDKKCMYFNINIFFLIIMYLKIMNIVNNF